jgi:hypothetical protein
MPGSTWAKRSRPGAFSALVDLPEVWGIGEETDFSQGSWVGAGRVSGDLVSSANSPFLASAGGKPFFIRREPFDPNGRG